MKRPDLDFRHAWTLALLGGLLASAAGVFLGVEVGNALQERALTEAQRLAVEPPRMVFDAVRLTQAHRRLAAEVLGGQQAREPQRLLRERELDQAMQRLARVLAQSEPLGSAGADWGEVQVRWRALAQAVAQRRLDAPSSHRRHGELIEAELDVHDRLLDRLPMPPQPWESALWQRTPRLLAALDEARDEAPQEERAPRAGWHSRAEAWRQSLAPHLRIQAPEPVRAALDAAVRRAQPPSAASPQALRTALAELLAAHRHWQQQQLAERSASARTRALRLAPAALTLLALGLLALRWGLARRFGPMAGRSGRPGRAGRTEGTGSPAAQGATRRRASSPADVGAQLTARLRRRARGTPVPPGEATVPADATDRPLAAAEAQAADGEPPRG